METEATDFTSATRRSYETVKAVPEGPPEYSLDVAATEFNSATTVYTVLAGGTASVVIDTLERCVGSTTVLFVLRSLGGLASR